MKKQISPLLTLLLLISVNIHSQGFLGKLKNETKKVDKEVLIQVGTEVLNQVTKKTPDNSNTSIKENASCSDVFGFVINDTYNKVQYFNGALIEQAGRLDNANKNIKNNNNYNGQVKINEALGLKVRNNYISFQPFLSMNVSDLEKKNNRNKLCEILDIYKQNDIEIQQLLDVVSKLMQNSEVIQHKEAVSNIQKQNEEKKKNREKEIAEQNQKKLDAEKHTNIVSKPQSIPIIGTSSKYKCNSCLLVSTVYNYKPDYSKRTSNGASHSAIAFGMMELEARIAEKYPRSLIVKGGCNNSYSGNHTWVIVPNSTLKARTLQSKEFE